MTESLLPLESVFFAAREITSPAGRAAYIDHVCAGDEELRSNVERMLAVEPQLGEFLETPVAGIDTTVFLHPELSDVGTQIGPYKLREVLGEGGMGIVYLADQEHPIRRTVALKVIKPGMDSREVIARLQAERQALALMDHPNIAKVHDAGTTDSGHPYFVMELVHGLPVTDYCDEAKLDLRERLKLFITICQAVQHAHQKGIIHRDLKPSNVMVALHDGVPVPKVIDFGVAKALNQRLTEHTLYSRNAQFLGTPMYMSPEQAELSGRDLDARSDVYSLGVLLYELLTSHTPFDRETLAKAGFDEVRRMIREVDPARPSRRISTIGQQQLSTIAGRRGLDGRQFSWSLRGELDWIVMKALEKDRKRRYGSAAEIAADVRRFLDHEPVQACPPSWIYRTRKLVRRKRAFIAAIGLALSTGAAAAVVVMLVQHEPGAEIDRDSAPTDGSALILGHDRPKVPERSFPASHATSLLTGLIPEPPSIAGMGRWQLVTRSPRSFVHHHWKLAWSPDSRQIAFGDGNDVRVYAIPSLELVRVCSGHESSVVAVEWSPDGTTIASSSLDTTVRLWNARTGTPGPVLVGHRDRVDAIAWRPDSRTLASGSRDFTIRLWHRDGTSGPVLRGHTGHVYSVAWNHAGSRLASTGEDGAIRIWGVNGRPSLMINTGHIQRTIAWAPNGEQVLTAQMFPGTARIWDLDRQTSLDLRGHTDAVTAAAFSPDGQQVASASWDDTVRLWHVGGSPGPSLTGFEGNVYSVAWSPDGHWIAAAGVDRSIRLFHADGERGPVLHGSPRVICLAWRPDGEQFAASVSDRTIRICDAGGDEKQVLETPRMSALALDWSTDCRQLVTGFADKTVQIRNVEDGAVVSEFPVSESELTAVAWSPHLPQIAVASRSGPIRILNVDGTMISGEGGERGHVYEVAWNPRDGRLASVGYDGKLRLWSGDGSAEGVFTTGEIMASVAWKPDGTQLASGSESGAIQLWHLDGRLGSLLKGHSDRATSVAWSTDGRWLASGGRDNTVRIWTAEGKERAVLRGHIGQLASVRWQPHFLRLLSASSDGSIRAWNVDAEQPEWIAIVLRDGQSMRFDSAGRLLSGDDELFGEEFAYIVEQPTGSMEILSPSEFERRRQQRHTSTP